MIALSTTKAAYIVVAESFKESKWLKVLVSKMCNKVCSVSVCCDSQSAIHLAKIKIHFIAGLNTFIHIKYNFIRDEVEQKRVGLVKDDTKENLVDMMTKPLPTNKFNLCMDLVSLAPGLM